MKQCLVALSAVLLCICGCAQEDCSHIDISQKQIYWQGYANEDLKLKNNYDSVETCLQSINTPIVHQPYPYVIVVLGSFMSRERRLNGSQCSNTIYISASVLYTNLFSHEAVHYITDLSNKYHKTTAFKECGDNLLFEDGYIVPALMD